jgi:hypothetical protein
VGPSVPQKLIKYTSRGPVDSLLFWTALGLVWLVFFYGLALVGLVEKRTGVGEKKYGLELFIYGLFLHVS